MGSEICLASPATPQNGKISLGTPPYPCLNSRGQCFVQSWGLYASVTQKNFSASWPPMGDMGVKKLYSPSPSKSPRQTSSKLCHYVHVCVPYKPWKFCEWLAVSFLSTHWKIWDSIRVQTLETESTPDTPRIRAVASLRGDHAIRTHLMLNISKSCSIGHSAAIPKFSLPWQRGSSGCTNVNIIFRTLDVISFPKMYSFANLHKLHKNTQWTWLKRPLQNLRNALSRGQKITAYLECPTRRPLFAYLLYIDD